MLSIPFLDLKRQYEKIGKEIEGEVVKVLRSCWYAGGPEVEAFEAEFAEYLGAKSFVALNSGTDAVRFALMAMFPDTGFRAVTTPATFIATTEGISQAGGKFTLCDIESEFYGLDPKHALDKAAEIKADVIIPVHLYGQGAYVDALVSQAKKNGVMVLEDACQAHGATWKGKKLGTFGEAAAFSFYPGKNLGACGEGGGVATDSQELAERIKMLRDHGQARKYVHAREGYNGRMDAVQAAALRVKLKYLDKWNDRRREIAELYKKNLAGIEEIALPQENDDARHIYHLFVIIAQKRDLLQQFLKDQGIATALHYPIPLHLQEAYNSLGYKKGDFPQAERVAENCLSLPMFPELEDEEIRQVASAIKSFYSLEE